MIDHADIATVVIISTLILLLVLGTAIMLLIVVHQRRIRHRAEMLELANRHANEIRQVEREVELQTLQGLSGELHDSVGQALTVIGMDLQVLCTRPECQDLAPRMADNLDSAVRELRRLSASMNMDHLRERSLATLIEEECARLDRPGRRSVTYLGSEEQRALSGDVQVVYYRIFQEAMNNALKHARANRITVTLVNNGQLSLAVSDNGAGFDIERANHGQGLSNIRKRAALVGASCTLTSAPGQGTTLIVSR